MKGCGRTFCEWCREEMIHRDHRHHYESASALGQIVHRLDRTYTVGDIDLYNYKRALRLLRLCEHKQPDQMAKGPQTEAHVLLDRVIDHYVNCAFAQIPLHPESGLYVMRGQVEAATEGRQRCELAGPQTLTNPRFVPLQIDDETGLNAWLDGRLHAIRIDPTSREGAA